MKKVCLISFITYRLSFNLFLSVISIFILTAISCAQTTGDYRTFGTALFSSTTNWQTYNGSSWASASTAPSNASTLVTTQAINSNFIAKTTIGTVVTTISGASTSSSSAVISVSSTSGVVAGQYVSGTNIPSNATVVSFVTNTSITISANVTGAGSGITLTLSTANTATGATTNGSTAITLLAANPSIFAGQPITGSGIPNNSYIVSYNSATPSIVISAAATATVGSVTLSFGSQLANNSIIELQSGSGISVGMPVSGTGVSGANYITATNVGGNANCIRISGSPSSLRPTNFLTISGMQSSNSSICLSASNASIVVGQLVSGTGIAASTYVTAISGTQLTLSQGASSSQSSGTLSFYSINIPNVYINHNTTVDASGAGVINNLFINNSSSGNAGSGATYTNATLTIGNNGTARTLMVSNITIASNASIVVANNSAKHTVIVSGTGNVITNNGTLNLFYNSSYNSSLSFTGSGSATINGTSGTYSFNDISIGNGTTLTLPATTVSIAGNITNSGTITPNASTAILNGTTAQTIQSANFYNLTANNSNGITLAGNVMVSSVLTLTNGIFYTKTYTLAVTNTATTAISSGSNSTYIKGTIVWTLPSNTAGTATYTFPLGDTVSSVTTYMPFSLINPITGSGAVTVTAQVFGSSNIASYDASVYGVGNSYWSFSSTGNFTSAAVMLANASIISSNVVVTATNGTYTSIGANYSSGILTSTTSITGATQTFSIGSTVATFPDYITNRGFESLALGNSPNITTTYGTLNNGLEGQWQTSFYASNSSGTSVILDSTQNGGSNSLRLIINSQTNRNDIKLFQVIPAATIPPATQCVLTFI